MPAFRVSGMYLCAFGSGFTAVDRYAFFGKVLLIFGHYITCRVFAVVKVICDCIKDIAGGLEFFERKIKQSAIVGLETDHPVLFQYVFVNFKKAAVCQSAFRISLFRPRVGKIEVQSVDRVLRLSFADVERVADDKSDVF